jgi:hypothetical protein
MNRADMRQQVTVLLQSSSLAPDAVLSNIDALVNGLDVLLRDAGF